MADVSTDLEAAARRLRLALDLFQAGEEMMRQTLRRQHPELSGPEIEARVVAWLQERPGAEFGDAPGIPRPWPRRSR
jgi:Rv0078B-related antitoxin